jgi:hypothetical protein
MKENKEEGEKTASEDRKKETKGEWATREIITEGKQESYQRAARLKGRKASRCRGRSATA